MLNIGHREDSTIEWTYLFLRCTGFSIPSDPKHDILMIVRGWVFFAAISAITITCGDFYDNYYHGTFNDLCYSLINILTTIFVVTKFVVILTKPQFSEFLQLTRDTLWGNAVTEEDKKILKQCEKDTLFYLILFSILAQTSSLAYIVEPVIFNCLNDNMTDVHERRFPLRVAFDWPIFETPNFQLFFVFELFFIYYASILWLAYDNYLALINIYAAGQFHILQNRLKTLYEKSDNQLNMNNTIGQKKGDDENGCDYPSTATSNELKECIRRHQFLMGLIEELDNIFTVINLVQVITFSLIICLVGYQLIMPGNPMFRRIKFIIYLGGCMIQLFSFSINCGNVTDASVSIAEGAYHANWLSKNSSKRGRAMTRDLMLIIVRTKIPSYLTGAGFFPVSLNIFSSTLRTAFSYLTLIRQYGV